MGSTFYDNDDFLNILLTLHGGITMQNIKTIWHNR